MAILSFSIRNELILCNLFPRSLHTVGLTCCVPNQCEVCFLLETKRAVAMKRKTDVPLGTLALMILKTLLKLEQEGSIVSEFGPSENNRRARFYRLTREGRKQLQTELRDWEQTAGIIGRFFELKAEDLS